MINNLKKFSKKQKGSSGILGLVIAVAIILTFITVGLPAALSLLNNATLDDVIRYLENNNYAYAAPGDTFTGDVDATIVTADTLNAPTGRTATYVIAASNAPDHVKAQADYVCDGTADDVEIQAAIDAASDGQDIQFSPGVFTLAQTVTVDKELYFKGNNLGVPFGATYDSGTVFKVADTFTANTFMINVTETFMGGFYGIAFDGTGVSVDGLLTNARDTVIQGCSFFALRDGVKCAAGDIWVNKCEIESCTRYGIFIYDDSCWISENVFWNNLYSVAIGTLAPRCFIINNRDQDSGTFCYVFSDLEELSITGNHTFSLSTNFILVDPNVDITYFDISNNIVIGDSDTGYFMNFVGTTIATKSQVKNNIVAELTHTFFNGTIPTGLKIEGNDGYLAPSEIRTASVPYVAGNVGAIAASWHNPEAQDIYIQKIVVKNADGATLAATAAIGIADDADGTNLGAEFFTAIPLDSADGTVFDSWVAGDTGAQTKWIALQDSASATDGWINMIIADQNSDGTGTIYITYCGQ